MSEPAPARLGYIPGLDGIRGFWVVIGPLLYHARPDWVPGGILGIDLFFVLSSYLIISIALNEWDRTGRIDVRAYAGRRARRLLPAMFALLAFLTVYLLIAGDPDQTERWTGGIIATLTYSFNWFEIFSNVSYFDQFGAPSPLRHVWSFAIEEQFYLFAPVFLILCLKFCGRHAHRVLLGASLAGALASAWWMAQVHHPGEDPSRAYYGTDTRAHSLLIGIAIAVAVRMYGQPRTTWGRRSLVIGAYISTIVLGIMIFTISEQTSWMFEKGGFLGVALLSGLMVHGVAQPARGPLHWFLECAPIRWVGKISYGLYLIHWPVYVLLPEQRMGFGGNALLAFHLALTFMLATVSFYALERPFTSRKWPITLRRADPWAASFAGALAVVAILAGLLAVNSDRPVEIEQILVAPPVESPSTTPQPVAPTEPPLDVAGPEEGPAFQVPTDRPLRVMTVGDSIMRQIGDALIDFDQDNPGLIVPYNEAALGCVIARYGDKRNPGGDVAPVGDHCSGWADPVPIDAVGDEYVVSWVTATDAFRPDVALIYATPWDVTDRQVPALGSAFTHVGNDDFDAYVRSEYALAVDTLAATGAQVFFLLGAPLNKPVVPQNDPARIARLNDLIVQVVQDDPRVTIVDYPGFIGPLGTDREQALRHDGVHLDPAAWPEVTDWLVHDVLGIPRSLGA